MTDKTNKNHISWHNISLNTFLKLSPLDWYNFGAVGLSWRRFCSQMSRFVSYFALNTYLLIIITMIVIIAPKKMKPPKMATAIIPSKLYLALARVLWDLTGVLKLARTLLLLLLVLAWWEPEFAEAIVVVLVVDEANNELTDCWLFCEWTWLIALVAASGVDSNGFPWEAVAEVVLVVEGKVEPGWFMNENLFPPELVCCCRLLLAKFDSWFGFGCVLKTCEACWTVVVGLSLLACWARLFCVWGVNSTTGGGAGGRTNWLTLFDWEAFLFVAGSPGCPPGDCGSSCPACATTGGGMLLGLFCANWPAIPFKEAAWIWFMFARSDCETGGSCCRRSRKGERDFLAFKRVVVVVVGIVVVWVGERRFWSAENMVRGWFWDCFAFEQLWCWSCFRGAR